MPNILIIKERIRKFDKQITVSGDKSISIRWVLFSSLASGVSKAQNLLRSEDVMSAIKAVKKLGIRVNINKKFCKIYGKGINGYKFKKNLTINAENSGTLGRLILGMLINTSHPIKLIGDNSLSKRDFKRVSDPLSKFGASFKLSKNKYLPMKIYGSSDLKSFKYLENKGSAQCKSAVILGGMKAKGTTVIKAKKSRDHTELLCKYLGLPIKVLKKKNYDLIKVRKVKKIKTLDYRIPCDISSGAFFIALTVLSAKSKLTINNVNINPSRIGIVTILKKMGIKIIFKKQKLYKGEKIADIQIESPKNIKPINCNPKLNSGAIDEFLVIFLIAAKANGTSYFKDLSELNQKESPRLKWGAKILNMMGIKTILTKSSIKIIGNPNLVIEKKIIIKDYLKDHRVFMTCVIAALSFGGNWHLHDKDSIKTSFPTFLDIINDLKK
jgi:3-phosphoshikimate 1-carboxyvinyltransferase